jgi:hypothetical protein
MVGGENLIPRPQFQGVGNDVDPMGGVGDKDQVVWISVQVFSQGLARLAQMGGYFSSQEGDGLAFQPALPFLVNLEYREGTGAKGAVV